MTENDKKKLEEFQKDFTKAKKASCAIDEFMQKHLFELDIKGITGWLEIRHMFHEPIMVKKA